MSDETLNSVKEEVRFFMEKTFQVSFGYAGALVALGASVKFDVLDGLEHATSLDKGVLLAGAVLVVNNVYLTLAVACLFAILKRGYFILATTASTTDRVRSVHRDWEIYVRSTGNRLFGSASLNKLAWNVDNYYMLPLFLFIEIASVVCTAYTWRVDCPAWVRAAILALLVMNIVIPGAAAWATYRLDTLCRENIQGTLQESK
jgi:hypothetical protein